MTSAFEFKRVCLAIDGATLVDDEEGEAAGASIAAGRVPVFRVTLPANTDHSLSTLLEMQGVGKGRFSYLRGYKFEVRSTRSFTTVKGGVTLTVVPYEHGDELTPIEERPAIRYVERIGELPTPAALSPRPTSIRFMAGGGFVIRELEVSIDAERAFTAEQTPAVIAALEEHRPVSWEKVLTPGEHLVAVRTRLGAATQPISVASTMFEGSPGRGLDVYLDVHEKRGPQIVFTEVEDQ